MFCSPDVSNPVPNRTERELRHELSGTVGSLGSKQRASGNCPYRSLQYASFKGDWCAGLRNLPGLL